MQAGRTRGAGISWLQYRLRAGRTPGFRVAFGRRADDCPSWCEGAHPALDPPVTPTFDASAAGAGTTVPPVGVAGAGAGFGVDTGVAFTLERPLRSGSRVIFLPFSTLKWAHEL